MKFARNFLGKAKHLNVSDSVFIWSAAIVYAVYYFANPALPGNKASSPEGWYGWFDQSQYLLSARSWIAGDFTPAHHYYPPRYPAIGALFYRWFPANPFFVFDGIAFVGFIFVFQRFACRYVSRIEALLIVVVSIYTNRMIMANFVIPWSSAGTIAIYSIAILTLTRQDRSVPTAPTEKPYGICPKAFLFAAVFSLLVIVRPVDAGLAAVFFPAFLYFQHRQDRSLPQLSQWRRAVIVLIALSAGMAVGIALFASYNQFVFGSPLGGYIKSTATSSGYFISMLPRKAFSLIFDSNTFFLEPGASIVSKYPWVLLSMIGMLVFLVRGDAMLRIVALAIIFHFCLYAPYGDLLPNGMWHFLNIHYFKWTFPYLMLFGWLLIRWVVGWTNEAKSQESSRRVSWMRLVMVCVLGIVICAVQFSAQEVVAADEIGFDSGALQLTIHAPPLLDHIDFIDFQGLNGAFADIYFGSHRLTVDGHALSLVRDFRMVPAPWGARLLFIHPQRGETLMLYPAESVKAAPTGIKTFIGTYHFSIGLPKLRHDIGCALGAPAVCPGSSASWAYDSRIEDTVFNRV